MGEIFKADNQLKLIDDIKTNNSVTLKSIYVSNFPKIEMLVLKNNGTKEHAKDIYQDAFIVTWNNIKNDKFVPQNETAIQGYLYTVAKNKWMDTLRSLRFKNTINSADFLFNTNDADYDTLNDDLLKDEQLEKVMQAFGNLGEPCKALLSAFYFEKKSMNTIAEVFNLDSASAKNKKYRCMQKLRDLALNIKL
ncbi:RNA polymerase sigma factor [Aquaticitalea lipolytica]|uniref:RNA polymerase sigma factor n=1 Tax=Aquaticitalea lipolytica TaxID=1247562 RepID=UPI0024B8DEB3|nr:sigma-70 family RNA polymerase sigma factor [Aquaticitalea lipolytica]